MGKEFGSMGEILGMEGMAKKSIESVNIINPEKTGNVKQEQPI